MIKKAILFLFLGSLLLSCGVWAAPTTQAATAVGNNNITFNAGGSVSYPLWFVWGLQSGHEAWKTPNQSSGSSYTQTGSPLYSLTTYYFRACDSTGCGSELSTTTASVTPLPTITLGLAIDNMSVSGFNMLVIAQNSLLPYQWLGMPIGVIFGWLFIIIFSAIWIRTRSVSVVSILGLISSGCLVVSSVGLQLPIPPELIAVAQMALYLTITACILILIKK